MARPAAAPAPLPAPSGQRAADRAVLQAPTDHLAVLAREVSEVSEVRAEGRDGRRLNPRKHDLRRWREVFAEKLRGWGIESEASSQVARGSRHRNEVRYKPPEKQAQRELPGVERTIGQRTRPEPGWER